MNCYMMILEDNKDFAEVLKSDLKAHYDNCEVDIYYKLQDNIDINKYDIFFLDICL